MENSIFNFLYRDKTIENLNKKIKLLGINTNYSAIKFMMLYIFLKYWHFPLNQGII